MNSWTITGNLGKDVESKVFDSGTEVAKFSVAVSAGWGDKKTTEWVNVSAWGKLGQSCQQYLSKGKKVLAIGELSVRPWTDKEGNNRFSLELNAREIEFLTPRDAAVEQQQQAPDPVIPEADLPF
jgi:single-strand DNA-binding protein